MVPVPLNTNARLDFGFSFGVGFLISKPGFGNRLLNSILVSVFVSVPDTKTWFWSQTKRPTKTTQGKKGKTLISLNIPLYNFKEVTH